MRALPLLLNALAACRTTFSDASDSLELSQSKNTMKDGGAAEGGGGGGAEATGGANLYWPYSIAMMLALLTPTFTPLTTTFAVVVPRKRPSRATRHWLSMLYPRPTMPS